MERTAKGPVWGLSNALRAMPYRGDLPGAALALAVGGTALMVADVTGWPAMLLALLAGLAIGQAAPALQAEAGVKLAATSVLRFGIVLLGARISVGQIADLGWEPFATILLSVPLTIAFGVLLARLLRQDLGLGLLSGGAVAVCGASAALAVSTVLQPRADAAARLGSVVAVVTVLSSAAMISYPVMLSALGFTEVEAGIVLGATIHDVGQAVASGYSVSAEAGDTSTMVKLARVMLLPAVILVLAALVGGRGEGGGVKVPGFILGFLGLAVINSLGALPGALTGALSQVSTLFLATAIAAIGMRTKLAAIAGLGWRLPALIALETLFLVALVTAIWL